MSVKPRVRFYVGYEGSTSETTANQNIWQAFPSPSVSVTEYRSSGNITLNTTTMDFTYSGDPTWLELTSVCNIYKGSGGNVNRNVQVVFHKNGVPAGPVRGSYMNNQDSQILSGNGEIYVENGDVITPMIRNIEDDCKINVKNCTFNFKQDFEWGY